MSLLSGLKVVEMATYIAAPGAGGILADWGADVIKIEGIHGDPIRNFFKGTNVEEMGNPVFDVDNRGKRSVAIDIKDERGKKALHALIKQADVFLTNVRPQALDRAGLDWEGVQAINPKVIYASVTGYGLEGDESWRPGFDATGFWARSGLASLTTPKGDAPIPVRVAVGDHTTSMATAAGILAALHEREKTGKGRLVETSLLRTGIYSMASDMSIQQRMGRIGSTKKRDQVQDPLSNFFKSKDGHWISVLPRQDGRGKWDWDKFCIALGHPELAEDERFTGFRGRRDNQEMLLAMLDEWYGQFDYEELKQRLDDQDLIWAPVQTPKEVVADPQAHAAGAFAEIKPKNGGDPYGTIASPVRIHGADTNPKGESPTIGEHTEDVLKELGLSDDDIKAMVEDKVARL